MLIHTFRSERSGVIAGLRRANRASGAPWVRNFAKSVDARNFGYDVGGGEARRPLGTGVFGHVSLAGNDMASDNLVPSSHSVTGNVRSGKVRQYTIFHWLLQKGCGNAIYAPIGLFLGALSEGLVFAS